MVHKEYTKTLIQKDFKMKTIKIKKCRLCNNPKLLRVKNFGNFFVSNFVSKRLVKKGVKAPLNLMYCKKCTLLQLEHSAPQEIMYRRFYWYRSGVTKTMRLALNDIYKSISKLNILKKNDVVLDIGANDGELLKNFQKKNIITVGCEPANNLKKQLRKNCNYVLNDFWDFKKFEKILKKYKIKKPKVITAIGMFYDLENPMKFIKDISDSLDKDGVFIAQLMCLKSMLNQNDFGNICHEHLEFYTFKSLKYLFESNGLKIFKVEENDINGGSYRIFCKKNITRSISYKENTSIKYIKKFLNRVENNKTKLMKFIKKQSMNNKKVFVYGASTKGNSLLQYYKIDKKIVPYAAERSPEKIGKYTIGSGIKIISEEKARKYRPDFFIVLPYGFINEFIIREKQWLKSGGKFILPYPKFKIVSK